MRVLYVHDYSTLAGGAELMVLRMRDSMRRRGHDARVFATTAGTTNGFADFTCFGTTSRGRTLLQTVNPLARRALRDVLKTFRPDVVHIAMFLTQLSPLILPLLRDFPCVYQAMWYRAVCPNGTKLLPDGRQCTQPYGRACLTNGCVSMIDWLPMMAQLAMTRRWLDVFDVVLPVSSAVRRELESAGIPCSSVITLGAGDPQPARLREPDPMLVGFAGRLVYEKGVDVLLNAVARARASFPDIRLLIIGDGPERAALAALAESLGIGSAVEFAGHQSRAEVERRLSSAAVQAVCSRWAEPFGLVAPEAMLRGTLVIASDSGGLAEIVEHGRTGLLVAPGSVDALKVALTTALGDPMLARAIAAAGREAAEKHYTEATMLDRLEALYGDLITAASRRAGPVSA